ERRRLDLVAELVRDQRRGVEIDVVVDADVHHPQRPELLDDLAPLDGHLLGQLGDGDRVAHADDALVLGGGGALRLLQLLAGSRDLLLREGAGAIAARPEAGTVEARTAAGKLAGHHRTTPEAPKLLVAILDLDARRARFAAGRKAGQLDEGTGRR